LAAYLGGFNGKYVYRAGAGPVEDREASDFDRSSVEGRLYRSAAPATPAARSKILCVSAREPGPAAAEIGVPVRRMEELHVG